MPVIHPPESAPPDEVLTVAVAAAELDVHPKFFYRRIANGSLPAYRLAGSQALRIRRADVEALKEPANRAAREPFDDSVAKLVAAAPPLTNEQRAVLAELLRPVRQPLRD